MGVIRIVSTSNAALSVLVVAAVVVEGVSFVAKDFVAVVLLLLLREFPLPPRMFRPLWPRMIPPLILLSREFYYCRISSCLNRVNSNNYNYSTQQKLQNARIHFFYFIFFMHAFNFIVLCLYCADRILSLFNLSISFAYKVIQGI